MYSYDSKTELLCDIVAARSRRHRPLTAGGDLMTQADRLTA
jgi:hypothetical protein